MPTVTSLVQRLINIQFSGQTTAVITGHRTSVTIIATGEAGMYSANCRIWGMSQQLMNSLSTLGMRVIQIVDRNNISIQAGDAIHGMSQVFDGTILNAWADYAAAPEVVFNVETKKGPAAATKSVSPTSSQGSVDVGQLMSRLASQAGFPFQNYGVKKSLSNPYLWGSIRDQMWQVVKAANIEWHIDQFGVAIWPRDGYRSTSSTPSPITTSTATSTTATPSSGIPRISVTPSSTSPAATTTPIAATVISPSTGMIGYPAFVKQGVVVKCLFNPNILMGSMIAIQGSSVTQANYGGWKVYMLQHQLDSMLPKGKWFTTLGLYDPKFGTAPVVNTGT